MIYKYIVLLFSVLVLSMCSNQNGSDTKIQMLHGNVKFTTSTLYKIVKLNGRYVKSEKVACNFTEDNELDYGVAICNRWFDRSNIIKQTNIDIKNTTITNLFYTYNSNLQATTLQLIDSSGNLISENKYIYYPTGKLKSLTWFNADSTILKIKKYEYPYFKPIKESVFFGNSADFESFNTLKFDKYNRIIEKCFYNSNKVFRGKLVYKYYSGGLLQRIFVFNQMNVNYKTIHYSYKYDLKANWVQRVEYLNDKPVFLTIRNVKYN